MLLFKWVTHIYPAINISWSYKLDSSFKECYICKAYTRSKCCKNVHNIVLRKKRKTGWNGTPYAHVICWFTPVCRTNVSHCALFVASFMHSFDFIFIRLWLECFSIAFELNRRKILLLIRKLNEYCLQKIDIRYTCVVVFSFYNR